MTVGQALERAEERRPGCKVDIRTRRRWLCEEDGMLRVLLFSGCGLRAGVGADLAWPAEGGLDDAVELLVPVPFDALYPHYLCAKLDAALGETERYAGEQARYTLYTFSGACRNRAARIFPMSSLGTMSFRSITLPISSSRDRETVKVPLGRGSVELFT